MAKKDDTDIAIIKVELTDIKNDVSEIKNKLDSKYVTQDQFDPVKKVVYGLITLILTLVVGALVGLVVIKK